MAQLKERFDASERQPSQGRFGQLPVGKHIVKIVKSDIVETKNKDGFFVEFDLEIIDGPLSGTNGKYRLNLYNSSAKAVKIAEGQITNLCYVLDVLVFEDTEELHDIPFMIEVELQKGENPDNYTEVVRVFDTDGNGPGEREEEAEEAEEEAEEEEAEEVEKEAPSKSKWKANKSEGPKKEKPAAKKAAAGKPSWMK